ncbi:MAG TPA: MBL fold metallo-hydrolase, partial [Acetobacteraceae bacterium]|nr:MBL fold metallo-hydrolase [Acetobacteraceae bacterium]
DGDGFLAVDTGVRNEETRRNWDALLAAMGRPRITRVLITHFHPDHAGLAGWLCERAAAPMLMPRTEFLQARFLWLDTGEDMMAQQVEFYRRAGCPPDYLDFVAQRGPLYQRSVHALPRSYARIAAGDTLRIGGRDWQVLTGQGHAPEMACLLCASDGIFISADQVLPRISPYIGVHAPEPEADPLAEFLTTLKRFRVVPEEVLVLPSHGLPFRGLHARLAALEAHHADRLGQLRDGLRAPRTVHDATGLLFSRGLDHRQLGFGIGETLAHLNRLVGMGEAVREDDADGVRRFARR